MGISHMEHLRKLLSNPLSEVKTKNPIKIEDAFYNIAKHLFNEYCIKNDTKIFRFAEVEFYYYLSGAILEQNKNVVTVIAQEAVNGSSIENAKENFEKERLNRKKDNQQKLIDFTKLEKDLAKSIKEMNAGSL